MSGSLIRATPPCARMSAGTRSSAITATAPASSAIFACSGVTTSMITPPLSISAIPRFTREVPSWGAADGIWSSDTVFPLGSGRHGAGSPRGHGPSTVTSTAAAVDSRPDRRWYVSREPDVRRRPGGGPVGASRGGGSAISK